MATRVSPAEAVRSTVDGQLRRVPGGVVYLGGVNDGSTSVETFLIDAAPVSVRRYARFYATRGRHLPEPLHWAAQLLHPDDAVTGVDPAAAAAFAQASDAGVGGRLPTVWEWQRAARGPFGLAPAPLGEPFGVTDLCRRWEWTSSPTRVGFWVCGGRYRHQPDDVPDVDHLAYEDVAATDVGFRVAYDAPAEPTAVSPLTSLSFTSPESPASAPLAPSPPSPPAPPSLDERLATPYAVPPRATWRGADLVVLDELVSGMPAFESESRAIWIRPDGNRWPAMLTPMWSTPYAGPRVQARIMWHALREGRHPPTNAAAFHIVDARDGVMAVFVERSVAGVRLRTFLDALAERQGAGVMPVDVVVAFVAEVARRGEMPGPVLHQADTFGDGQLAWDGTWHPRFDAAENTLHGRFNERARSMLADLPSEAIHGRPLDARATVYRMGLFIYRLLAGVRPWAQPADTSMMATLREALQGERHSIRDHRPDLPDVIAQAIDDAVAVDRDARPGSVDELFARCGFDHAAPDVAPADVAAFFAAVAADLFPRTREAELSWWEGASMIDIATAPAPVASTPLPTEAPSVERWLQLIGEIAAQNNVIT